VHDSEDITDENSVSSDRRSRSLSVSHVVSSLEFFCLLLGNAASGDQFSAMYYYSLGWPSCQISSKLAQTVPLQVRQKKICGKNNICILCISIVCI